ncbi:hypothetical protein SAY87_029225 [Trapa incisa]|uniref:Clp R domain-containing protein n=1 Tax=Trapa incisa TaxID=236973 RepID=A0AAN7KW70_9MYRT|nr:hypothetical protein SAY87_029225 [Trapa incisa]
MRAGLSTIQQTLTPEAAGVLNLSIAEAARRNHGQTTPLHVAATLLASPSGFLRQACIKSHPNSSHPLQCRALELCFSVALERLLTSQGSSPEPPVSNALMAALKRAQAHQRRGCPEQQQQPLLAVKIELEQLIISILDDPGVSRVMREASFSSPAVKATIEQSLNSAAQPPPTASPASVGLGFCPSGQIARNLYLNPRLQQQQQQQQPQQGSTAPTGATAAGPRSLQQRSEDVNKVIEILSRSRKRNPVLVGELETEAVLRELVKKIEAKELTVGALKNIQVISLEKEFGSDKSQILSRLKELGGLMDACMVSGSNIVLDLGDLKWFVEQPAASFGSAGPILGLSATQQQVVPEMARTAVVEVGRLLGRYGEVGTGSSGNRVWLIGTATCETYLRCQVYHPSMETDWDLQAVPIAARSPLPRTFPMLGTIGIVGNSTESLSQLKNLPATSKRLSENQDSAGETMCCPKCAQDYEEELVKLRASKAEESSPVVRSEAAARTALPQWLQNAEVHSTQGNGENLMLKQKIHELQKKWKETCLRTHAQFHQQLIRPDRINPAPFSLTGLYKPNPLLQKNLEPKPLLLQKIPNAEAQMQTSLKPMLQSQLTLQIPSPPGSPVQTDLVLGRTKGTIEAIIEKPAQTETLRDFLGGMAQELPKKVYEFQHEKLMTISDTDSFKKLLKGLMESVWWQRDAASALATIMNRSRLGIANRISADSRGDLWILFGGPDQTGKRKMGSALSELVCGAAPLTISFGSRHDSSMNFRGKTTLDRIAEGVRRNPFSVIILEDVDEADTVIQGSIKRAMERGRITDSHGREISLGNVTFILTANWAPENVKFTTKLDSPFDEAKLTGLARGGWKLKLSVSERASKRRASWLHDASMAVGKRRKEMDGNGLLGFDLNETVDNVDDQTDASHNSSDLTVEQEWDNGLDNRLLSTSLVYRELLCNVDDTVIFRPMHLGSLQEIIASSISDKFSSIFSDEISIEIQDEVLERILGGVWMGNSGLDEWMESALIPSFEQVKALLQTKWDESMVVRLECDRCSDPGGCGEWLPQRVELAVDRV